MKDTFQRNGHSTLPNLVGTDETRTQLTARMEPFDSYWQAPDDVEKGYKSFGAFYKHNYLKHMPANKNANILVVSCGPGYFINMLNQAGYRNVLGIDSFPEKVKIAGQHGLNCIVADAFRFLEAEKQQYDVIYAGQELNHLTKDEMVRFLKLCWNNLRPGGTLIVYGLNGANPITGAENLAHNFDHFNLFTENSLEQVLKYTNFTNIKIIPLNLYVFFNNPANYVLMAADFTLNTMFRGLFKMYGKKVNILTKKIGAVCVKGV